MKKNIKTPKWFSYLTKTALVVLFIFCFWLSIFGLIFPFAILLTICAVYFGFKKYLKSNPDSNFINLVFKTGFTLASIAVILLIFWLFTFGLWRPFDNMITEDRPIIRKLCNMQNNCGVGSKGVHQCGYSSNTPKHYWQNASNKISNHPWYKGCNESTPGFFIGDGGIKYVQGIESCGCGAVI